MSIRNTLIAGALAVTAIIGVSASANAGMFMEGNRRLAVVPCDAFSGTTFACVTNNSGATINYIMCDNIRVNMSSMDGPLITNGTTGVAHFPRNYCTTVVYFADNGKSSVGSFIDVRNNTSFVIPTLRW